MFLIVSRCLTTGAGGWDGPGGGGGGSSQFWQTPAKADGARAAPVVSRAEAVNRPSSAARRRPGVDRVGMVRPSLVGGRLDGAPDGPSASVASAFASASADLPRGRSRGGEQAQRRCTQAAGRGSGGQGAPVSGRRRPGGSEGRAVSSRCQRGRGRDRRPAAGAENATPELISMPSAAASRATPRT